MFTASAIATPKLVICVASIDCVFAEANTIISTADVLKTNEKTFLCLECDETATIRTPNDREIIIGIIGVKNTAPTKNR